MAMAQFRGKGLTVRTREPQDNDGLLELFNEPCFLHDASAREPFPSCEDMRIWLDGIAAAQRFEVVALLQNEVIGFGGLYALGEGQSHLGWLMLGVREAFQRQGIGSILMHMLIGTAQVFVGLQRIQLTVFSDNIAAINLYKQFGFEIEGRHQRFARRGADFVDAFTMAVLFEVGEVDEPNVEALRHSRFTQAAWSSDHGGRWVAGEHRSSGEKNIPLSNGPT
jgi:putative acetyltransferase